MLSQNIVVMFNDVQRGDGGRGWGGEGGVANVLQNLITDIKMEYNYLQIYSFYILHAVSHNLTVFIMRFT